jgi:hypothetical protein
VCTTLVGPDFASLAAFLSSLWLESFFHCRKKAKTFNRKGRQELRELHKETETHYQEFGGAFSTGVEA